MLRQIQDFIFDSVEKPALADERLEKEFKTQIRRTMVWIRRFRKPGDLLGYMKRFAGNEQHNDLYHRFNVLGLKTFEDLYPELVDKFGSLANDCTNLEDFVIGMDYTSYDIAIFANLYNVQSGIYAVRCGDQLTAVFIKATIGGSGKYANEWIQSKTRLKYFLKSINDRFSLDYQDNKALLDISKPPIYVFEKVGTICSLVGIYTAESYHQGADESLWCELVRRELFEHEKPSTEESYEKELELAVNFATNMSCSERRARLSLATKKPKVTFTITTTYERNPNVIAEVLSRANGQCERCFHAAPFIRKSDNTPYLEVHHIQFLAENGDDSIENAIALCPNCHRFLHFGTVTESEVEELKSRVSEKLETY